MANESISLLQGLAAMEKSLDAALAEQRGVAHGAIDMDDWGKAQEILAAAKKNISAVEDFKKSFADFRNAVLSADLTSELGALGVELPINSSANGSGGSSKEPADEPEPAAVSEPAPESVSAPEPEPEPVSAPAPEPEPEAPEPEVMAEEPSGFSIVDACEELIAEFPFAMMTCYSAPSVGGSAAADETSASEMTNARQLSNGVWIDAGVSEERAREIVNALREYCEQQKG